VVMVLELRHKLEKQLILFEILLQDNWYNNNANSELSKPTI
jgi:hypothetical protein